MPLARVLAEQILPAELPRRGGAPPVAGAGEGRVAAAEVADGVRVFGEPDEAAQVVVKVRAAGEGQHPLPVPFPQEFPRVEVEGEGDRSGAAAALGADDDEGSASVVGVHGVGGDVLPLERRRRGLAPRRPQAPAAAARLLQRRGREQLEGAGAQREQQVADGEVDGPGWVRLGPRPEDDAPPADVEDGEEALGHQAEPTAAVVGPGRLPGMRRHDPGAEGGSEVLGQPTRRLQAEGFGKRRAAPSPEKACGGGAVISSGSEQDDDKFTLRMVYPRDQLSQRH
ncbi:hypothetical protein SEVIR_9G094602v4 [Setaria viridis]